jgi:pSer/pThr/pTyr-binding forkhead associated (FHA) protein
LLFSVDVHENDVVGRDPICCDVVLVENRIPKEFERYVSRIHFRVVCVPGFVRLENRSNNGTFVNNKKITSQTLLQNGDLISVIPARDSKLTIFHFSRQSDFPISPAAFFSVGFAIFKRI